MNRVLIGTLLLFIFGAFNISCSMGGKVVGDNTLPADSSPEGLCAGTNLTNSPFAAGSGTSLDPFIICTAAQFFNINSSTNNLSKHYEQRIDIDFSYYDGSSAQKTITPIGYYDLTFFKAMAFREFIMVLGFC